MDAPTYLMTILTSVLVLLALALTLALVRLVRGPTLPDRVIALEVMASTFLGMTVVYAIRSGQQVFLDVAIALAVTSFLATVAFALYLEKRVF